MSTGSVITDVSGRYPRQLWYIVATEVWERFCMYGLWAVLLTFLKQQLGVDDHTAGLQFASIQAFVFASAFIGGVLADKVLGLRRAMLWGAVLTMTGAFLMAALPLDHFYTGICFVIMGSGFFKPSITAMVGQLYRDGDPRRDAGFSLFYMGVNLGALLGWTVMEWVARRFSWQVAFAFAGAMMIASVINFMAGRNALRQFGAHPVRPALPRSHRHLLEVLVYSGSLLAIPLLHHAVTSSTYTDLFMTIIGPLAIIYLVWEMRHATATESAKVAAAMVFVLFHVVFWAFFQQSGASLEHLAEDHLQHRLFGFPADPAQVSRLVNSLFVVLLAPVIGLLWIALNRRAIGPASAAKIGFGFLVVGVAFFTFQRTRVFATPDGRAPMEIYAGAWLLVTVGELCIAPISLSLMTKLAPERMHGAMLGTLLLAGAYGHYIAPALGGTVVAIGDYAVTAQPAAPGGEADEWLLAWKDIADEPGTFSRMELTVSTREADSLAGPWQDVPGVPVAQARFNDHGDTVAWRVSEIPNIGSARLKLPTGLTARKDRTLRMAPRPIERLDRYVAGIGTLAIYALVCGALLIAATPLLRRWMADVR